MLSCATVGTNDLPRAAAFYDEVLGIIHGKRVMESGRFIAWGTDVTAAGLGVTMPFDGNTATVGNGCMVALQADSRATVDRVHARALELGGSDEGAPGQRFEGFYAVCFRDLDGNKLNVCFMGAWATPPSRAVRRPRHWRIRQRLGISGSGSARDARAMPARRRLR